MKNKQSIPMILTAISAVLSASPVMANDVTAYINGNIYTANADHEFVSTVVVEDGILKYVGNNAKAAMTLGKDIEVVDLKGKTVVPGLYDSHIHPIGAGEKLLFECKFSPVASVEEILETVSECAKATPEGSWVRGGSWGSHVLTSKNIPSIKMLDKVSHGRPVLLTDYSHHNVWANSKALELTGVTSKSAEKFGKLVVRDSKGKLTGIFLESAGEPISHNVPARSASDYVMAAEKAVSELNKIGIIGVKDSYVYENEYNTWKALDDKGELSMNVALSWGWPANKGNTLEDKIKIYEQTAKPSSGHLYAGFTKMTIDGIPPTKTASMIDPYLPTKENIKGELMIPEKALTDALTYLDDKGYTVQVHAVGDNAARSVLNVVETVREENGESGLRHEIAHACIVAPSDIERFSELSVVPNFSPIFWYPSPIQDGLEMAIGKERAERNCAVKTLIEDGAIPTGGSDWPVSADVNPWKAMESLITRKDPNGLRANETLWSEQRIDIEQALELYTVNGAKAQRRSDKAGSIEVGKSADMLVLSQNVFKIDSSAIGETEVEKTIFEGKTVYESAESKVNTTVEKYIESVFNADINSLRKIFHAKAVMAGDLPHAHLMGSPEPFLKDVASRSSMASQNINYITDITYLDVQGDTASVTLEEENFFGKGHFINYLSLIKEEDEWKIVSKVFTHK